jgi:hypothetical protein
MKNKSSKKPSDENEPEKQPDAGEVQPAPQEDQGSETLVTREKNPAAVELGRRGGLKGGKARAAKLTAKQRKEIAKKAAQARWKKS